MALSAQYSGLGVLRVNSCDFVDRSLGYNKQAIHEITQTPDTKIQSAPYTGDLPRYFLNKRAEASRKSYDVTIPISRPSSTTGKQPTRHDCISLIASRVGVVGCTVTGVGFMMSRTATGSLIPPRL